MTQIFIAVQEQEAKRRRIAALSGELEALYLRLQMLIEDVQTHHQNIRAVNRVSFTDWTGQTAAVRYRYTGLVWPETGRIQIQIKKTQFNRFVPVYRPVRLVYRLV